MPRLSDSMEEGTIIRWLLTDGESVTSGTEIVEIETDKATMEFQSEFDGVLQIVEPEGATVPVGAVIGHVGAAGERIAVTAGVAAAATGNGASGPGNRSRTSASPVARRLAEALSVDLSSLTGSGPSGRVVKRDVVAAAEVGQSSTSPAVASSGTPQLTRPGSAGSTGAGKGRVTIERPTRVQTTIARRMSEAKATMPEFTLEVDVDMSAVIAMRAEIKALDVGVVPSFNDFVIRACALALNRHPRANGAFREGHFELYERVNVGVAVAVPSALVVPTVTDADRRSLGEIARETRRLAAAARAERLTAAELSAGTFTVSNLGMFGITRFTAVLNPPQAAILAVGALEQRPIVRDGEIAIASRMPMTLTCDHRLLYGADAAMFLADIRAQLEAPLRLAL